MKNKLISTILSLALTTIALFSTTIHAKGNDNIVTFKAAIVIPPCSYDLNKNNINLSCFDNESNKMKSTTIDFSKQNKSTEWKQLDNNRSIYQFKWTNKDKEQALFSVEHA